MILCEKSHDGCGDYSLFSKIFSNFKPLDFKFFNIFYTEKKFRRLINIILLRINFFLNYITKYCYTYK